MAKALYRKYRSKKLSEIVGQDHIVATLSRAISTGKLSHAYLFTGPRGVGKTSIARIVAHEINQIDYEDERLHLDIIEIDAASNRRIDEIRDLRDKIHIAPTSAKYKVYIIDEVHMLTREAFNALLKTLEEPPEHCIFILATTELHKLPATIVSRTQRFHFQPIEVAAATQHLKEIANKEKITIEDDALTMLAQHGEGSFRDSISLLDQLAGAKQKITTATVAEMLGLPPRQGLEVLLTALKARDSAQVLHQLSTFNDSGYGAPRVASELAKLLRQNLVSKQQTFNSIRLLRNLLEVPTSPDPNAALELALLEETVDSTAPSSDTPKAVSAPVAMQPSTTTSVAAAKKLTLTPVNAKVEDTNKKSIEHTPTATKTIAPRSTLLSESDWPSVLKLSKQRAASLYTALRLAQVQFDEKGVLTLAFQFALHQKKVNEQRNKQLIHEFADQLERSITDIVCIIDKAATTADITPLPVTAPATVAPSPRTSVTADEPVGSPDSALMAISNIFGPAEVLES